MNDLPINPYSNGGFNPMRWQCRGGEHCYLECGHLRKELFADCFPGKIAVSDIDMIVEVSGRIFMAEWKPRGGAIDQGQERLLESLGKCKDEKGRPFIVMAVYGDAITLEIDRVVNYRNGQKTDLENTKNLEQFRNGLIRFSNLARGYTA